MVSRTAAPKCDQPGQRRRIDKARERQDCVTGDALAGSTDDETRDLAHGEGGTLDLPRRPSDLARDD